MRPTLSFGLAFLAAVAATLGTGCSEQSNEPWCMPQCDGLPTTHTLHCNPVDGSNAGEYPFLVHYIRAPQSVPYGLAIGVTLSGRSAQPILSTRCEPEIRVVESQVILHSFQVEMEVEPGFWVVPDIGANDFVHCLIPPLYSGEWTIKAASPDPDMRPRPEATVLIE